MSATSVRGGAIWWTRTKERQAWCNLQVKLCHPCLSALRPCMRSKWRYINTLPFLSFYCSIVSVLMMLLCQSEVPVHESVQRPCTEAHAESVAMTSNVTERRSSEAFYVNIPSSGLQGRHLCDEFVTGDSTAKSRSVDNIAEEASYDGSLDLVITEADDAMQLSDSQKCNGCIVWSLFITHTQLFCWPFSSSCGFAAMLRWSPEWSPKVAGPGMFFTGYCPVNSVKAAKTLFGKPFRLTVCTVDMTDCFIVGCTDGRWAQFWKCRLLHLSRPCYAPYDGAACFMWANISDNHCNEWFKWGMVVYSLLGCNVLWFTRWFRFYINYLLTFLLIYCRKNSPILFPGQR